LSKRANVLINLILQSERHGFPLLQARSSLLFLLLVYTKLLNSKKIVACENRWCRFLGHSYLRVIDSHGRSRWVRDIISQMHRTKVTICNQVDIFCHLVIKCQAFYPRQIGKYLRLQCAFAILQTQHVLMLPYWPSGTHIRHALVQQRPLPLSSDSR
jgi:hypothetical protein